ncbi:MAG: cyclase family protein [Gammaproteobacteria bacterium]|nr:MAG: cyclase family protein [Gammaproteobacteria bacterium]TDJ41208.1 MAG: cyclase family protein [Gammaproteobacteria bacterium]
MATQWTPEHMRSVFESVKNWGRWGEDDEAGALNLITSAKRLEAARTIRAGVPVSCALELAVQPAVDNPFPALHMMIRGGDDCVLPGLGVEATMDFVGVAFHGMATTHIDALCHVFVDGLMYNGFEASEVKSTGARRGSIMCAKDGIVSRGVLLDIPRSKDLAWLEPGTQIRVADLEAAERAHDVTVGEGDILIVATGRDARRAEHGPWVPFRDGMAGLHPECVPWLHERNIAVLGCDGVSDVFPSVPIEGWAMPIHQCTLAAMGVHLLDNLRLDDLCNACAEHEQYAFQFTVAPLRVEGGTGSPCNPIAVL